jgi:hypothetical protein
MRRPYLIRVGDWMSAGLNTLLLGGAPDESTSGRSWREGELEGNPVWQRRRERIDWLIWWEADHCRRAYAADLERARVRVERAEISVTDL